MGIPVGFEAWVDGVLGGALVGYRQRCGQCDGRGDGLAWCDLQVLHGGAIECWIPPVRG